MCIGSMTIVKLMVQELAIMSYLATQESSKEEIKRLGSWLLYLCNSQLQTLWFLNLLIRHVLKCITLLPANPAIPMVEVTVLLVVKKC